MEERMDKKLVKSTNSMVTGTLAGVAEYLNIDPTVARIVFVFLLLITGLMPGVLIYFILWILMPEQ
ncbi:PspC domain-containing protein [bacterium]|nr:PspC domain-containing protein [bacterium]